MKSIVTIGTLPILRIKPAQWSMFGEPIACGEAENRIKELKQDFGAESFNLKDFYATQGRLDFFDDSLQFNVSVPAICSSRKNAKNTIYTAL